jgi:hypothetical protein
MILIPLIKMKILNPNLIMIKNPGYNLHIRTKKVHSKTLYIILIRSDNSNLI